MSKQGSLRHLFRFVAASRSQSEIGIRTCNGCRFLSSSGIASPSPFRRARLDPSSNPSFYFSRTSFHSHSKAVHLRSTEVEADKESDVLTSSEVPLPPESTELRDEAETATNDAVDSSNSTSSSDSSIPSPNVLPVITGSESSSELPKESNSSDPLFSSLRKRPERQIQGFATLQGTLEYEQKFAEVAGAGHFKTFFGSNSSEALKFSSIGAGSYTTTKSPGSFRYIHIIVKSLLQSGVNVFEIPTAFNSFNVHHVIGNTLSSSIAEGDVSREQVILIGKGGLVYRDNFPFPNGRDEFLDRNFISRQIFTMDDVVGRHCISPTFLDYQLKRTLHHAGVECIDFFLIQNVELLAENLKHDKNLFYERLEKAFEYLESACEEKKISYYGITCQHLSFEEENNDYSISLEKSTEVARTVGGEGHRFKLLQVPYNLTNQVIAERETQYVNERRMNVFSAAKELGLNIVSSPSNYNMNKYKQLLEDTPNLDVSQRLQNETERVRALQFSRTSPLLSAFMAAKGTDKVKDLLNVIKYDC